MADPILTDTVRGLVRRIVIYRAREAAACRRADQSYRQLRNLVRRLANVHGVMHGAPGPSDLPRLAARIEAAALRTRAELAELRAHPPREPECTAAVPTTSPYANGRVCGRDAVEKTPDGWRCPAHRPAAASPAPTSPPQPHPPPGAVLGGCVTPPHGPTVTC